MHQHALIDAWKRRCAIVAMVALGVIVPCARETGACVTCAVPSDALTPIHPKSLEIALATRAAIDAGDLPPTLNELRDKAEGRIPIGMQEVAAPALLKYWLGRLKFKEDETCVIHFLCVDTQERQGIAIGGGAFSVQETPSEKSDATVVTTRHVLRALSHPQIDIQRAKELGVLLVEGKLPASLAAAAAKAENSAMPTTSGEGAIAPAAEPHKKHLSEAVPSAGKTVEGEPEKEVE